MGVSPTHLTRALIAKSIIILYTVVAQLTAADHSEVSSLLPYIVYRLYMAVIAHHWSSSGIQVLVLTVVILFSKIMGNKGNSYPFTLIGHEMNDYWTTNLKKRSFIDRLVKNLHLLHIQSWFPLWNQIDTLSVFHHTTLIQFLPLQYFLLLIL